MRLNKMWRAICTLAAAPPDHQRAPRERGGGGGGGGSHIVIFFWPLCFMSSFFLSFLFSLSLARTCHGSAGRGRRRSEEGNGGGRGSNCCQPYVVVLLVISIYWFNSFFSLSQGRIDNILPKIMRPSLASSWPSVTHQ